MKNFALVVLFLSSLAFGANETGAPDQVLRVPHTGGRPKYGQLDLSQTAATVNQLPISRGGTGQSTATAALNALLPTQTSNSGKYFKTDGTNASWVTIPAAVAPTIQKFLSGSGTYTTPAGVLWVRIRMVGGGGGGSGSSTVSGGNNAGAGGAGGDTTFGTTLLVANGGGGAPANTSAAGGTGGAASLGTGPIGVAFSGAAGQPISETGTGVAFAGGRGAESPFAGAGAGGRDAVSTAGSPAVANTGSGGGGAGGDASFTGAGGGAGGYVDAIISSPSATYSYAVGAAGTAGAAGTGGAAGGAGGAGIILVEEHYN